MQNFKRIETGIDTSLLLEGLRQHPDLWDIITARQNTPGSPHTDTKCIFMRGPREKTVQAVFHDLEAVDYEDSFKLMPYIDESIMKAVADHILSDDKKDFGRMMITSLKPGGVITKHTDEGDYADRYERFHLCLQSDPLNVFYSETEDKVEEVHMAPGELWWFNHKAPHWVENMSSTDRIHLIIDAVVPQYRVERR